MDPVETAFKVYREKFGQDPPLFGIQDEAENIIANINRAVVEGRELWTFYYDENPYKDPKVDI